MKPLHALFSALLIVPALPLYAEDSGKSTNKTVDEHGTSVTTETSHSDRTGVTGVRKSTSEVKTVVDPKGMMNREMAKSYAEREVKPNGDFSEEKVIDHANGTREKITVDKSTAKHWTDKGETVTTTQSRVVDPKGLGNKQTYEAKQQLEKQTDGTTKKTVTEKMNGEVVAKEVIVPQ